MATAVEVLSRIVEDDSYLRTLLAHEAVDTSATAPVRKVQAELAPLLRNWAGLTLLSVQPSGSFAKGTAIRSGTDIDLFLSLLPNVHESLGSLYESLYATLRVAGYAPRRQNVSLNIRLNGFSVDLVPAHRHHLESDDHSLYVRRSGSWIKTNVAKHIAFVRDSRCQNEIRILKLWRNQLSLDFPSFYLELVAIRVLTMRRSPYLSANVSSVFEYLRDAFSHARFVDPANGNNVLSDGLTPAEKHAIADSARHALATPRWREIVH